MSLHRFHVRIFLAPIVFASIASAAEPVLPVREHRLASGVRVVLAPDDALDDVSVAVGYRVGTADDPTERDGLAHLTEHLLCRGSQHVESQAQRLEEAGAWGVNAHTSLDYTIFHETVPPGVLPLALWVEADRMRYPLARVDEHVVEQERAIIANEVRDRRVDPLLAPFQTAVHDDVFPAGHPYHSHEDDPAESPIAELHLRDVRAFLRTWYSPANATLVISGHFDPTTALALATKYFGSMPSTPPPERPPLPSSPLGMRTVYSASLTREYVFYSWRTPALGAPGDQDLDLVASILTGRGGRLTRSLIETGLATTVNARQVSHARASEFVIFAAVSERATPDAVAAVLDREIEAIRREATPDEVALAKKHYRDANRVILEGSGARTGRIVLHPGSDPLAIDAYAQSDVGSVVAAAKAWLTPENGARAIVHKAPDAPLHGKVVWRERVTP